MQIFALAVLIFGLAMVMDLHALFQDKKRKLGLLEDEGISNFADVASAKNQNFEAQNSNDDFGGISRTRGIAGIYW